MYVKDLFFVVTCFGCAIVIWIVRYIIPDMSEEVENAIKRQDFIENKLRTIRTSVLTSTFDTIRFKSNSGTNVHFLNPNNEHLKSENSTKNLYKIPKS